MRSIEQMLDAIIGALSQNLTLLLGLVIGLWLLHMVNALCSHRLNNFGIIPRTGRGLIGIFISPFLHGDANHLFFNTVPLFVMATFLLVEGRAQFYCVSLVVIILAGFLVWLFGRRASHIGASTLIMGYWSYLLINAYHEPSLSAVVIALVCLYYFGGLFLGLFPTDAKMSWEGHLFGFIAGIVANYASPTFIAFFR